MLEKLKGSHYYKKRVSKFRIVFSLSDNNEKILLDVLPRDKVYEKLRR